MKPKTATDFLSDSTKRLLPLFAPFRSYITVSAELIEEYLMLLLDFECLRGRPLDQFYTMLDELVDMGWWNKPNADWEILAINPVLSMFANHQFSSMQEGEREAINTCFINYYTETLAPKSIRPYLFSNNASAKKTGHLIAQYEVANLESAIRLASARGLLKPDLYTSLDGYWRLMSFHDERLRLSSFLIDHFGEIFHQSKVLPEILFHRAAAQKQLGKYADAERTIYEALSIVPDTDNSRAVLQQQLGNVFKDQGRHLEAVPHFEAALTIYQKVGDEEKIAEMYQNLGVISREKNDNADFQSLTEKAINLYEKQGRKQFQAIGLQNLAAAWVAKKDYEKALEIYFKALEITQTHGDQSTEAIISRSIGVVYSDLGQLAEAKTWFQRTLEIYLVKGAQDELGESWFDYGSLALKSGNLTDALAYYDQATQAYQGLEGIGKAKHMQAYIYSSYLQKPEDSIPHYQAALHAFEKEPRSKNWIETQYNFGNVLLELERYREAVAAFKAITDTFESEPWPPDTAIAYSYHNLTLAYYNCSEREKGGKYLQEAKKIYQSLSDEDSWLELIEEVEEITGNSYT